MEVLRWMGENWFITLVLAGIASETVIRVFNAGKVKAADAVKLKSAKTVQGQTVAIDAKDGVKINDANVIQADIEASNGVIHVIDTVLLPPAPTKRRHH